MAAVAASVLTLGQSAAGAAGAQLVWSTLSPPDAPPPLAYASAAYDSDNRTVVLFGGVTSSGALSNSTWVWDGSNWKSFAGSQIVSPAARELASMSFDPALHQLVLFGGRAAGGEALGDTWAWNGASWYQVGQLGGPSPSPREGAAMAYDGHGNLVLFGGDGPPAGSQGSEGSSVSRPATNGRTTVAAAASVPSWTALGDTWLWAADGWVRSPATGPGARTEASLAFDSTAGSSVMFGGSNAPITSGSPGRLSDTWTWNGSAWSPVPPAPPSGAAPGARFGSAAADDPQAGGIVMSGGSGANGLLADTWVWDGHTWTATPAPGSPPPRAGAGAAFDAAARQYVLFGGAGNAGSGAPADAKGNYGSTIGGADRVLGGTYALTAGPPVGLGTPASALRPTAGATAPTSLPPDAATPTSAGQEPQNTGRSPAANPFAGRGIASPLQVLRPGQLVTVRGSGFSDRAKVTVTFHSTPVVVGTTTAHADGSFEITVAVPQSAAAGTHRFIAAGNGPNGPLRLVVATVKVVVGNPGSGGHTGTVERAALLCLAVAFPAATWLAMGAFEKRRRARAASD